MYCLSRQQIDELVRGIVHGPEADAARGHVAECEPCRQALEVCQAEAALLARLRQLPPSLRSASGTEADPQPAAPPVTAAGADSADRRPSDHGRFVPGTILLDRYRVVSLLGQGGMGEVYQAEDLRLGQTVALKFLTVTRASDPANVAALYAEVRAARMVAHANVGRVFDVGEWDGMPFITMEYIDGEDLGALLRRIGRLPVDKALDVARQLCAALTAIHAQGLLHRDLKPANVMIDGRGKVRVNDFGLAAARRAAVPAAPCGTPAYMAPELFAGHAADTRADVYALGLVLYEVFTGKRALQGRTWSELIHEHEYSTPTRPSRLIPDLDPVIERAILKCIEKDPRRRPASALVVAAALPGGDALAMALEAGETPSPELVATARVPVAARPLTCVALVAATFAGLCLYAALWKHTHLLGLSPPEYPPAVLVQRSREILAAFGYTGAVVDWAGGYQVAHRLTSSRAELDQPPPPKGREGTNASSAVVFWYRQSPEPLDARDTYGQVRIQDPPALVPGMVSLVLDARGRLLWLHAVPYATASRGPATVEMDPAPLFAAAGLNLADFGPAEPEGTPPVFADRRAAWEQVRRAPGTNPVRVEAAALCGCLVYFRRLETGVDSTMSASRPRPPPEPVTDVVFGVLVVVVVASGFVLARRNLLRGRADLRGAVRGALYVFLVACAAWVISAHHVWNARALLDNFIVWLGEGVHPAALFALMYLALEPHIRRHWPRRLVAWTRVLAGHWRDPLVGRDVLIGIAGGVAAALITPLAQVVAPSSHQVVTSRVDEVALTGCQAIDVLLRYQPGALMNAMMMSFVPLLIFLAARRRWVAALGTIALWATLAGLADLASPLDAVRALLIAGTWTFVALRFGVLAAGVQWWAMLVVEHLPLTTDLSVWYASVGWIAVLPIVALSSMAFFWAGARAYVQPAARGG